MVALKTFTVSAERGRGDGWVLEAPEAGAVSQVRRLDRAEDEMCEAIAYLASMNEADVAIEVSSGLPVENLNAAERTARARKEKELRRLVPTCRLTR